MRSEWYVMADDERGTMKLEFNRRMVFLHLALKKPLEGLRAVKDQFPSLLQMLRNIGYRTVNVIIPEGNDALYRFEEHFGFREASRIPAIDGSRHILMSRMC